MENYYDGVRKTPRASNGGKRPSGKLPRGVLSEAIIFR